MENSRFYPTVEIELPTKHQKGRVVGFGEIELRVVDVREADTKKGEEGFVHTFRATKSEIKDADKIEEGLRRDDLGDFVISAQAKSFEAVPVMKPVTVLKADEQDVLDLQERRRAAELAYLAIELYKNGYAV